MNDTLYVPEHFATLPPGAHAAVDVALSAPCSAPVEPAPPAHRPATLPVVGAAEIARHVPADPLVAQGYRAALRVVEVDRRTEPGNDT